MDEFQILDQTKVFLNIWDIKIDNLNFDMTHFTREGSFVMNSCLVFVEIDFLCKSLCTLIAKEIHLVKMMMTDQIQSNYDALTFTFKETISVINDKNTKFKKTKSALIKVGG